METVFFMRLWTIHPKHLDTKGLVALWREGLGALKALTGEVKGYRNHPQLDRFKAHEEPVNALNFYLHLVADEADRRGYKFKREKLLKRKSVNKIKVTKGQVDFEVAHLKKKLKNRNPEMLNQNWSKISIFSVFKLKPGDVELWEKI